MIVLKERDDVVPLCPHCNAPLDELWCRALARTVGTGHESAVEAFAARIRLFSDDPVEFERRVVDDVQQYLHDTFVDTTCPRARISLIIRSGTRSSAVAPLGGLADGA